MPNKGIEKVYAVVCVADFEAALRWYEGLLGRSPDHAPADGLAEWHLGGHAAIQVYLDPDRAGDSLLTLSVSDVDKYAKVIAGNGLDPEEPENTDGGYRVSTLADPSGNTVTLAQPVVPDSAR
ncbi:VOC family protein [Streptomyces sp. NBC_01304]|uniref:VOC family protein n=1 Tax=Streptomyces sp. NBC_01304 TaxID=2903818 RepID=UPI002E0F9CF5|nr:VOC family protein [Streptomyces sp. NBC_01304]